MFVSVYRPPTTTGAGETGDQTAAGRAAALRRVKPAGLVGHVKTIWLPLRLKPRVGEGMPAPKRVRALVPEVASELTTRSPVNTPSEAGEKVTVTFCTPPAGMAPDQFPLYWAG